MPGTRDYCASRSHDGIDVSCGQLGTGVTERALAVARPVREASGTPRPTKIKRSQAGDQAKRELVPRLAGITS